MFDLDAILTPNSGHLKTWGHEYIILHERPLRETDQQIIRLPILRLDEIMNNTVIQDGGRTRSRDNQSGQNFDRHEQYMATWMTF